MGIFKSDEGEGRSKPRTRRVLPLLPLRDIVVYPHMVVPLYVGRQKSIAAVTEARSGDGHLLLAAQRQITQEEPAEGDIHAIGTIGLILQHGAARRHGE
jgi:ATP-dependent Lon protease